MCSVRPWLCLNSSHVFCYEGLLPLYGLAFLCLTTGCGHPTGFQQCWLYRHRLDCMSNIRTKFHPGEELVTVPSSEDCWLSSSFGCCKSSRQVEECLEVSSNNTRCKHTWPTFTAISPPTSTSPTTSTAIWSTRLVCEKWPFDSDGPWPQCLSHTCCNYASVILCKY